MKKIQGLLYLTDLLVISCFLVKNNINIDCKLTISYKLKNDIFKFTVLEKQYSFNKNEVIENYKEVFNNDFLKEKFFYVFGRLVYNFYYGRQKILK